MSLKNQVPNFRKKKERKVCGIIPVTTNSESNQKDLKTLKIFVAETSELIWMESGSNFLY